MANLRKGQFTFHGSFTSKLLAAKHEAKTPGSFIIKRGDRYYLLKEKKTVAKSNVRRVRKSNPQGTLIYPKVTRIEATKGPESNFPNQKFYHKFKRPYPRMIGLANGDLLITSRRNK